MINIIQNIFESACRNDAENPPRGYLGMSSIGAPCEKQSWFAWRQTTGQITDGRVLILFEFGRHVEQIICQSLRLAGYVLTGAFPDPQLHYEDCGGFFAGHPDGVIDDSDGAIVLEAKSANTKKFKEFGDKGVAKVYPAYMAQVQLYMGYSGLKRALFVVMKKDNSDLYTEIVPFDPAIATANRNKAARIIQTHDGAGRIYIPERISDDPRSDDCKWCRYRTPCFSPSEATQTVQSCRSCVFLRIGADFLAWCGNSSHPARLKNISIACPQWVWVERTPF